MKYPAIIASCAALLLSPMPMAGCGGVEQAPDNGAGGQGDPVCGLPMDAEGYLVLTATQERNYAFSSTLAINETPVAARSNLTFDWSAVSTDLLGHEVDPLAGIDMVSVFVWNLGFAELVRKMNAEEVRQMDYDANVILETNNAVTSSALFDFEFIGGGEVTPEMMMDFLDPAMAPPENYSYTVVVQSGTTLGKGFRMVQGFRPDSASTNTQITLTPDSVALEYEADLTSLQPVQVPTGEPFIVIDWDDLHGQPNALGGVFGAYQVHEVMVAKYSLEVTELEDRFLDLELIADKLYRGNVEAGTSFSLAQTATEAGELFQGIDDTGTWLVALRCLGIECLNPAPKFLTLLQPCAAAPAQ